MKTKYRQPRTKSFREVDKWRQGVARALNRLSSNDVLPAFSANPASNQTNFAIDQWVDVVWGTEIYDLNGDFDSNVFTAPVTGYYHFDTSIYLLALDFAATNYRVRLSTSNRSYTVVLDPRQFSADVASWSMNLSALADMDEGDTAKITVYQNGGSQQTDIYTQSHFTGYLVTPVIWN